MASTKLSRTAGTPTSSKKFTISFWVKRSNIGSAGNGHIFDTYVDSSNRSQIHFDDDNVIDFRLAVSGSNIGRLKTNRVFRDVGAFYHIVASVDTTLATADDRVKLYINGVQETSFSSRINPSQNADFPMNGTHTIGAYGGGTNYFDGILSYFAFVDGTAYTPTSFGETNAASGIWKINTAPSVTYGTNGCFLKMDTSSPGSDTSGNNNTFTAAGTPTLAQDNASNILVTLNPLLDVNAVPTFLNGNTTIVGSSSGGARLSGSSISVGTGKWYYEIKTTVDGSQPYIGVIDAQSNIRRNSSYFVAATSGSNDSGYAVNMSGDIYYNNSSTYASNIGSISTGNILGFAVDLTSTQKTCTIYKNGTSMRTFNLANPSSDNYMLGVCSISNSASAKCEVNFGNGFFGVTAVSSSNADAAGHGLFEYAVPTGFFTLNTKNLNTYGG